MLIQSGLYDQYNLQVSNTGRALHLDDQLTTCSMNVWIFEFENELILCMNSSLVQT